MPDRGVEQDTALVDTSRDASSTSSHHPSRVEQLAITSGEFGTIMAHFYRGEVTRSNVWRQRLDGTFNWAVLTTGATLSFAFGDVNAPHVVILINTMLIAVFLFIEARRYRYYEVWSSRVRVIETDYIAPLLSAKVRAVTPSTAWAEHLAEDLLRPHFTVGLWEAVGRRLRRNYIWIFVLLAMSWTIKVAIHPATAMSVGQFVQRAAIGSLSGYLVMAIGVIFNGLILAIALMTISVAEDQSEVSTSGFDRGSGIKKPRSLLRRDRSPDPDMTATFQTSPRGTGTLKPRRK